MKHFKSMVTTIIDIHRDLAVMRASPHGCDHAKIDRLIQDQRQSISQIRGLLQQVASSDDANVVDQYRSEFEKVRTEVKRFFERMICAVPTGYTLGI